MGNETPVPSEKPSRALTIDQTPNTSGIATPGRSRSSQATQELDILIRARYPIIYVSTWEEERVEQCLRQIANARKKHLYVWTVTQGIIKSGNEGRNSKGGSGNTSDPLCALDNVIQHVEPAIYLFKDFHRFMCDERCNLTIIRKLRDVAFQIRDSYKSIVITSPLVRIAIELSKDVTLMEFGLPDTKDFSKLLDRIIDEVKDNPKVTIDLNPAAREQLLQAARGLTLKEAENVFAKTLVTDNRLTAEDVQIVFSEKRQIIRKDGLLEYCDPEEDFSMVAGLENLKTWLDKRSIAFTDKAKQFGLPPPRGVLLLGVQGCGKSLCAKATASMWHLPLLRFDLGRMFSSLVGSSEENVRRAIQVAESVAPAVLWIDEIDKAFAGASSSSGSDGGTSSRVFGTLLTWLSEKKSSVFVIATANDISKLPPELLRKGRLDEIFYLDLPNFNERKEIFRIHLAKRDRAPDRFDLDRLSLQSDGFNGAEIEESVVSSLFDEFSSGIPLDTEVLLTGLKDTVPLSKTMSEELSRLREWATGRARPATRQPETSDSQVSRRKIEL